MYFDLVWNRAAGHRGPRTTLRAVVRLTDDQRAVAE